MQTLIQNADLLGEGTLLDVLIDDGVIVALGRGLAHQDGATILDADRQTLLPGLIDVHVHYREPGFEQKETIATGAAAAAHGGFTTTLAMPNLDPVPDTVDHLMPLLAKNASDAKIHVRQFASLTQGRSGNTLVDFQALHDAGAIGFSDDGSGIQNALTMYQAMQAAAKVDAPIAAHIEDASLMQGGVMNAGRIADELGLKGIINQSESSQLARDLDLAAATGVHYHACHISTRQSVELIRAAKKQGVNVTAEVSPHHLLLDETDIHKDDPMMKMNPPLRSRADHLALIEGLADGTLDLIATDHAPHTAADKAGSMATAAFGIVGSETAFATLYTQFVESKMFTLAQLINWMSTNPATLFNLPGGRIAVGAPADLTLVDLTTPYTIDAADFLSKGKNSPFIGREVRGKVRLTLAGGQIAYQA
ncbi:dihydroorotase [Lacticaseibacillus mingshuiensis]|uniref:Dihydroorotase n=1 Tax=Lacticaseibacillus mingshuiensis TaxID=2799574 RepID=A0ABW4CFL7_9LACO|nr:dihydroorotase [Lacticaseibacillus mingshuiensis]